MSKPISIGDLVVVLRGHQCGIGKMGTVVEIFRHHHDGTCKDCGARLPKVNGGLVARLDIDRRFAITRLKRIPPLDEMESAKRDEGITA